MFPVCLTTTKAGHLKQSSIHWMNWGMMYAGRYLTAKISEYPNHEIECTLSDIIEENVPEKYYLSRKQAEKLLYKEKPTQGERIYSSKGLSCTLTSGSGGFGGHSGLYLIENTENFGLPIKSKTKDGYQIAYPGDSIDTAFSGQNSRRGRVGSQIAHTLTTSATQAYYFIDLNPDPKLTEIARCITARHDSGISNRRVSIQVYSLKARILQMMKNSQLLLLIQTAKSISAESESLLRGSAGDYKASRTISSTRQKRLDYPTAGFTRWQEMR